MKSSVQLELPHSFDGARDGGIEASPVDLRLRGDGENHEGRRIHVDLADEDLASVRLSYAQHISKQQGATVTYAFALTAGWQTSRESTYVQATRPRDGCEWFIARADLGSAGHDEQRIHELANRMRDSRRQIHRSPTSTPQNPTPASALRSSTPTSCPACSPTSHDATTTATSKPHITR
jgi:hypothetical protein